MLLGGDGLLRTQHPHLYAAIEFATFFFVIVGGNRIIFAVASGNELVHGHSLFHQVVHNGLGAVLRKLLVIGLGSNVVGVTGNFHTGSTAAEHKLLETL